MDPSLHLLDHHDFDGTISSSLINARLQHQDGQHPKMKPNHHTEGRKAIKKSNESTIPLHAANSPTRLPSSLLVTYQEQIVVDGNLSRRKSQAINAAHKILGHGSSADNKGSGDCNDENDDGTNIDQSGAPQHIKHVENQQFVSPVARRSDVSGVNTALSKMSLHRERQIRMLHLYQDGIGIGTPPTATAAVSVENEAMKIMQRPPSAPLCCTTTESSPLSGNSRRPKRRRRGVRFEYAANSVYPTISRMEMTNEEIRNSWLQHEEFTEICERDESLIARVEQEQNSSYCIRGLESKMKLNALRTQSKRLKCLEKVLIEQDRQWDYQDQIPNAAYTDGCCDEAIAAASMSVTEDCKIRAQQIASNDRLEVERFVEKQRKGS